MTYFYAVPFVDSILVIRWDCGQVPRVIAEFARDRIFQASAQTQAGAHAVDPDARLGPPTPPAYVIPPFALLHGELLHFPASQLPRDVWQARPPRRR
jgi:hypothetical protein